MWKMCRFTDVTIHSACVEGSELKVQKNDALISKAQYNVVRYIIAFQWYIKRTSAAGLNSVT